MRNLLLIIVWIVLLSSCEPPAERFIGVYEPVNASRYLPSVELVHSNPILIELNSDFRVKLFTHERVFDLGGWELTSDGMTIKWNYISKASSIKLVEHFGDTLMLFDYQPNGGGLPLLYKKRYESIRKPPEVKNDWLE